MTKLSYEEKKALYRQYFSLTYLGNDGSNKLALLSLICWLYHKYKEKKPDVTMWQVVWKVGKDTNCGEDFLQGLSIVCEDLAYNCSKWQTWGIADKDVPKKIKELLKDQFPF